MIGGTILILSIAFGLWLIADILYHCAMLDGYHGYGKHSRWWKLVIVRKNYTSNTDTTFIVKFRILGFPLWVTDTEFDTEADALGHLRIHYPSRDDDLKQ